MRPLKPDSDCGRLLRAYVDAWPAWIGGYDQSRLYGFNFHTQSQRSGDLTRRRHIPVESRKRASERYHEFRFKTRTAYLIALSLVRVWDTGLTVEQVLRIAPKANTPVIALARVEEDTGDLVLKFSAD